MKGEHQSADLINQQATTSEKLMEDSQKSLIISQQAQAYLYGITSFVSIVIVQLLVKKLTAYFPAFLILGIRAGILVLIYMSILQFKGRSLNVRDPKIFKLLIIRSLISGVTMTMYLSATQFIQLGIATTFFNTSPLFVFFMEAFYFKKYKLQWIHVLITLLCFCGVVFIIQPEFLFGHNEVTNFECIMYLIVLLSAMFASMSMILVHDMRSSVDQYVTLTTGSIFHSLPNYILYSIFKESFTGYPANNTLTLNDSFAFVGYLTIFAGFATLTQYTRVKAMYLSQPSKIMPLQYISVIMGMILDVTVLNASYNKLMIIGAIFTSCGLLTKLFIEKQKKQR